MKNKDHPIVLVTWVDANEGSGDWTDLEDIKNHKLAKCQDLGWLVAEDEEKITVMRSRNFDDDTPDEIYHGGGFISIPNTWILEILEFKDA